MREHALRINIYGDSLMRGTVIDENYRFHTTMDEHIRRFQESFNAEVNNRSRFGVTSLKGLSILAHDVERGVDCEYALIEYGGNDCNFRWKEIAENPEAEHEPLTIISRFKETLRDIIDLLKRENVTPVLMTLPPIDAEKYLSFIGRTGCDVKSVMRWLGDVQAIYRFQELYSRTVERLALDTSTMLIDVRSCFLEKRFGDRYVGLDGIHLTPKGYSLVYEAISDYVAEARGTSI